MPELADAIPELARLDAANTSTLAMMIVEEAVRKGRVEERARIADWLSTQGLPDDLVQRVRTNELRPRSSRSRR